MTGASTAREPVGEFRPRDWDEPSDDVGFLGRVGDALRPDEGWLSLVLVLAMAATMAWSIADARWILGRDDLTSFVIWIAVAAAVWGYVSARLGISPWKAHVLGAALGAIVLIEVVGSLLPGAKGGPAGWFGATAGSVAQAYLDLTWRHQLATTQFGHFCLIIGIVVWGTVQSAAYDVFGYHRAINGVLLMAVILLANMALTLQDQFPALVFFTAAALWLLLKAHAADERTGWLQHRIWRGGDLRPTQAKGGFRFAAAAVCGALILTTVASSAPLANAWGGFDNNFHDVATWISAFLPAGNGSRIAPGADFGGSTKTSWSFNASGAVVLTIAETEQSTAVNTHWRVVAYDNFKSVGWAIGNGSQSNLDPGEGLDDGTLDQVDANNSGRTAYAYAVTVHDASLKHLVVANEPALATIPVARVVVGSSPDESNVVWYPTDAMSYTVTSLLPDIDPTGAGLTEWRLRQAGTDYPPSLLARYTQGADLVLTPGQRLLSDIESWAGKQGIALNPKTGRFADAYDAAKAIQAYLRESGNFTYDSNVADLVPKCESLTTVDCFAVYKRGFCEQYATTMTMLMRMEGYPARYVQGFLSGHVDQFTRQIVITGQQRHAWVEVYFPGYGWIPFDPTGGSVGQPTVLPPGSQATASPSPKPSALQPSDSGGQDVRPRRTPGGTTPTASTSNGWPGGLLLPAVISLVVLLALVLIWRRRPRRLQGPDAVYRGVVKMASRLGYKPLPTQTVFEYTGMLADIVPRARSPLAVVAMAEVEVTYGRRKLATDRLLSLAAAQQRVRRALLRLVFRLPGRGPRSPQKGKSRRR